MITLLCAVSALFFLVPLILIFLIIGVICCLIVWIIESFVDKRQKIAVMEIEDFDN